MPSPFPGMDPFLESLDFWHGFRLYFLVTLLEERNRLLPSDHVARIGEHEWEATEDGLTSLRERCVEVVALQPDRRIVTIIELLSPGNKVGYGQEQYRKRQQRILQNRINLLEINLLRGGEHTVALPVQTLHAADLPQPYVVCLNRATQSKSAEFWPFCLDARLPRVAVPLHEDESDIPLDLQAVFSLTYDRGAFARQLDYIMEVTPPLSVSESEWVNALLADKNT